MNPECATCKYLGICTRTDAQKILTHFVCEQFQEVTNQEVVQARSDVINKFGEAGLKAISSPETNEEA